MTSSHDGNRDTPIQSDLLSVTEAARLTGLSRSYISGWIGDDKLPVVRIAGRRYVTREDLLATQASIHLGTVVPAWRQDPVHAGRRLREIREAAGLNQIQLAAASGLTNEAISRLETGHNAPYADTVRTLARALRVDPTRFVGHEVIGLRMLTAAEAASRLDVPVDRLQTWLRQGELAGVKVSGQWRVTAVAIAELGRSGRLRGESRRLDPRFHG